MKSLLTKIFVGLVVIALSAFTVLKLMSNQKAVAEKIYKKNTDLKPLVDVQTVATQKLSKNLQLLGTFQPNREIDIVSEAQGKVTEVGVEKEQQVSSGKLIARLDSELLQAQLIAVKAQYEKAQTDVERFQKIVAGDALPKSQLEQAELALKSAESQVKVLQKQISQAVITAPFGGVITQRMFDFGSVVAPGMPLARLTDISQLKLVVQVPEKDIATLYKGRSLEIKTDLYADQTFTGKVHTVASKADAAHNYEVEILTPNSQQHPLRAGMYGYVRMSNDAEKEGIVIPRNALVGSSKNPQVYVVEKGVAKLRTISIGGANGEELQVISGLSDGETIVVSGQINLTDNIAVSVK